MAVAILEKNHSWYFPFVVPPNNTVIVDVEAGGLVDILFLKDNAELEAFKAGRRDFSKITAQTAYYSKVNLAKLWGPQPTVFSLMYPTMYSPSILPGATWYLVIANHSITVDIPIFCRVYNSPDMA